MRYGFERKWEHLLMEKLEFYCKKQCIMNALFILGPKYKLGWGGLSSKDLPFWKFLKLVILVEKAYSYDAVSIDYKQIVLDLNHCNEVQKIYAGYFEESGYCLKLVVEKHQLSLVSTFLDQTKQIFSTFWWKPNFGWFNYLRFEPFPLYFKGVSGLVLVFVFFELN